MNFEDLNLADYLPANFGFAWPWMLIGLLILPFVFLWRRKAKSRAMTISTSAPFRGMRPSLRVRLRWLPRLFRALAMAALIIALARPQTGSTAEYINSEGIDIVLTLDVSGSMMAEDLKPNRLQAAKGVADKFIRKRTADRIGLVIFSGEAFSACPITADHRALTEAVNAVRPGQLEFGTAIGDGLASAVDRLRRSKGKSRVVILLTDGENTITKHVGPETALELAIRYNIKVYAIGVGTIGLAPSPVETPFGVRTEMQPVSIDEPLLRKISSGTGGSYFRATDNNSLNKIFESIDKLEKTDVEVTRFRRYTEWFYPFALAALVCLFLEMLLRWAVFRRIV